VSRTTKAQHVRIRGDIVGEGSTPALMLKNVLNSRQRNNEIRVEIEPIDIATRDVVQVIGGSTEKYAAMIPGTHHVALPES
jgi:hypothetical protein